MHEEESEVIPHNYLEDVLESSPDDLSSQEKLLRSEAARILELEAEVNQLTVQVRNLQESYDRIVDRLFFVEESMIRSSAPKKSSKTEIEVKVPFNEVKEKEEAPPQPIASTAVKKAYSKKSVTPKEADKNISSPSMSPEPWEDSYSFTPANKTPKKSI